jgi:hypothetical protein
MWLETSRACQTDGGDSVRGTEGLLCEDRLANKVAPSRTQALVLVYGNRAEITHFDHDTGGAST